MLCEKCGKHIATTHITTMVNGVVTEQNLCNYCGKVSGFQSSSNNPLSDMLSSMLIGFSGFETPNQKMCPICGSAFSDISKNGKAGCPECYITFKEEFLPYLKRIHGSTKHNGKTPNNQSKNDMVIQLKSKLKKLVDEENFEEAAVVRDKIKALEADGNE